MAGTHRVELDLAAGFEEAQLLLPWLVLAVLALLASVAH